MSGSYRASDSSSHVLIIFSSVSLSMYLKRSFATSSPADSLVKSQSMMVTLFNSIAYLSMSFYPDLCSAGQWFLWTVYHLGYYVSCIIQDCYFVSITITFVVLHCQDRFFSSVLTVGLDLVLVDMNVLFGTHSSL